MIHKSTRAGPVVKEGEVRKNAFAMIRHSVTALKERKSAQAASGDLW
jgi:hypothetical protein